MYSVLLYRIKKPGEVYDVPLLHDTFYAEQFAHTINCFEIVNFYVEPPPVLVKHIPMQSEAAVIPVYHRGF